MNQRWAWTPRKPPRSGGSSRGWRESGRWSSRPTSSPRRPAWASASSSFTGDGSWPTRRRSGWPSRSPPTARSWLASAVQPPAGRGPLPRRDRRRARLPRADRRARRARRLGSPRAGSPHRDARGDLPPPHPGGRGGRGAAAMRGVLVIAGREIRAYFLSPIAYGIAAVFLALSGFFFFQHLADYSVRSLQFQFPQTQELLAGLHPNQQILQPVFDQMSIFLLFITPILTMRLIAEERRSGSFDLLMSYPQTESDIVVGKYMD